MFRKLAILIAIVFAFYGLIRLFTPAPEITNPKPRGENLICFGDSLTFGTGAPPELSYPAQLSRLMGRPVINAGRPGDTTASALARLEEDVLAHSPSIVFITLGGNDLRTGVGGKAAFGNLKTIIESIQARGALVVLGGLSFPIWDRGYGTGYRETAEDTGAVLVPDILDEIMGREELMSDPIHPNAKGYAIMAARFFAAVEPYLHGSSSGD
ncbi:MAG: GDSL-type esterase/lipase family protein [Desulfobulbaceae bacterium]|nr:GDSL-type esterase/lipase family protein [Desulfobulbaceae bacterium]